MRKQIGSDQVEQFLILSTRGNIVCYDIVWRGESDQSDVGFLVRKIALFGNCQLEVLQSAFSFAFPTDLAVTLVPPIHKITLDDFPAFHDRIAECDRIYVHFLSERHGPYSYRNLKATFRDKLFLVPNLECEGYHPQIAYFSNDSLLPELDYVDFRLLELFLAGVAPDDAAECYNTCNLDDRAIRRIFYGRIGLHLDRHVHDGVIFDYSRRLAENLRRGRCFWTFNHPMASELEWVANKLLEHLSVPVRVTFNDFEPLAMISPPMLTGVAEALGIPPETNAPITYWSQKLTFQDYAVGFYQQFARLDRDFLGVEFDNSLWAHCRKMSD